MANVSQKWLECLSFLIPFTRDYGGQHTASNISLLLGQPQRTAARKLDFLCKQGLLKFSRDGKNKNYFLNLNNQKTKELLFVLEGSKTINFLLKHEDLAVFFNELSGFGSFILFGSYAKNRAKKDSDVDLVIIGRKNKKIESLINMYPLEINVQYILLTSFRYELSYCPSEWQDNRSEIMPIGLMCRRHMRLLPGTEVGNTAVIRSLPPDVA